MKSVAADTKEQASRTLGRLPLAMTKPAPMSGANTASKSRMSVIGSILSIQLGELACLHRAIIAVHGDNDAQGDGDFRSRKPHDEKDENLADGGVVNREAIEGH